jgi:hypothetical protein
VDLAGLAGHRLLGLIVRPLEAAVEKEWWLGHHTIARLAALVEQAAQGI